ncbi:MAG TPA: hypothetical protein VEX64_05805, partial [Pyrinomonadaceae bacterium]|nr:hypothetical protein [Pyrinomonadaceae bacterium]
MSLFLNTVSGQDEQRLSAAWQVTKYNIAATLPQNPADRNLSAKATVSLKNVGRGAGATVTFRINQKAEIISAKIGASDAGFRKTVDDKLGNLQRFTVTLQGSIQPDGAATVTIDYRIPVAENSGLIAISSVGSQFLPLSNWFPTPNNPYSPRGADYAPFNLNVSGASGETVVSSGKASSTGYEQALNAQPFFVTGSWDLIESGNGISVYL